jgi:hypothetical protein
MKLILHRQKVILETKSAVKASDVFLTDVEAVLGAECWSFGQIRQAPIKNTAPSPAVTAMAEAREAELASAE